MGDQGHRIGEQAFDELGGDGNSEVIDLLNIGDVFHVAAIEREFLAAKLRGFVVGHPRVVPHRVSGGESAAIVEFHPFAQLEKPTLVVVGVNRPGRGEAGDDVGRRT